MSASQATDQYLVPRISEIGRNLLKNEQSVHSFHSSKKKQK